MSRRPAPSIVEPDGIEDRSDKFAQEKNKQAWNSLRRFGQPLAMISVIGASVVKLHEISQTNGYNNLIEPAVSFPLAGLAIASVMNIDIDDPMEMAKNYAYMFAKGLLVSTAIFLSDPSAVFFTKLNEGWFKDIFTGNMLHQNHGFGFRTMVLFHTLNLFTNSSLVKFIYKQ
jgi:hypothetical protein